MKSSERNRLNKLHNEETRASVKMLGTVLIITASLFICFGIYKAVTWKKEAHVACKIHNNGTTATCQINGKNTLFIKY